VVTKPTVLVVEDDAAVRRGLLDALAFAGFRTLGCSDGHEAAQTMVSAAFDLVLLDVMLPGRDGFSLLEDLRRTRPTTPVILVTARGAEEDRVRGLRRGADDYVVKPFSARELIARVEAVLRRSAERPQPVVRLRAGGIEVDLVRREVRENGGEPCALTERETELQLFLAERRDRAVAREELLRGIWHLEPRGLHTRTVDMHVARLREKITPAGGESPIATVRGKGYMLAVHVVAVGPGGGAA
jgi:DNA-binding response OmpR family regulator